MKKSYQIIAFSLTVAICTTFLVACSERSFLIIDPIISNLNDPRLDTKAVNIAYAQAIQSTLNELCQRKNIKRLNTLKKNLGRMQQEQIDAIGPNFFKEMVKTEKVEGVLYPVVTQPFDSPFVEVFVTFLIPEKGIQTHHSYNVQVNYEALYSIEFWQGTLNHVAKKMEAVL